MKSGDRRPETEVKKSQVSGQWKKQSRSTKLEVWGLK